MVAHGNMSDLQLNQDITLGRLQQLDQRERVLVGLFFYESLTVDEISMVLHQDRSEIHHQLQAILGKVAGQEVTVSTNAVENVHG